MSKTGYHLPALLLIAHGSRHATSNEEIFLLRAALEKRLVGSFSYVGVGFLELASPSIPEAIAKVAAAMDVVRAEAVHAQHQAASVGTSVGSMPVGTPVRSAEQQERPVNSRLTLFVLPYFLASGAHVKEDVPEIVSAEREHYPRLNIELLPYVGKDMSLTELIAGQLEQTLQAISD